MKKYDVKLGQIYWSIEAKDEKQVAQIVAENIEKFHPLNSSEEGAEAYRNRFRGKPFHVKLSGEKDYHLVESIDKKVA